jgi:hypothetical protein
MSLHVELMANFLWVPKEGFPLQFEVGRSAPTHFAGRAIVPPLWRELNVALAAVYAARSTIIRQADAVMVQGPPVAKR